VEYRPCQSWYDAYVLAPEPYRYSRTYAQEITNVTIGGVSDPMTAATIAIPITLTGMATIGIAISMTGTTTTADRSMTCQSEECPANRGALVASSRCSRHLLVEQQIGIVCRSFAARIVRTFAMSWAALKGFQSYRQHRAARDRENVVRNRAPPPDIARMPTVALSGRICRMTQWPSCRASRCR